MMMRASLSESEEESQDLPSLLDSMVLIPQTHAD